MPVRAAIFDAVLSLPRYYEIITYGRKLLLGDLSVFLGRGQLAQAYFVVVVESW